MKGRKATAALLALTLLLGQANALTVEQARQLIEQLYVDEVSEEVLDRDTIEGIFEGLDQHSSYLSPETYQSFWGSINEVPQVGLGLLYGYTEDQKAVEIHAVYEDGAAWQAGMTAGDLVLQVDDQAVADSDELETVASWMKGEEGTTVTLLVRHSDGTEEWLELTRCPFTIPYTTYELREGHIGYLDCDSIGQETYGHFVDALDELGDSVDIWVLDLRDNTGGLTAQAAEVAGIFSGTGVKTVMRQKGDDYYTFDAEGERTTIYPVIALVNQNTASAAEQIAGDIRDETAGVLIGTRTYGKGTAQSIIDKTVRPWWFVDGDAVRITSARFYSYNGLTNDKVGILPHLLVEPGMEEAVAYLLCGQKSETGDYLRIQVGAWQWYVELETALEADDGAWRAAFVELLEALPPDVSMVYYGTGEAAVTTPEEVAQRLGLEEFTPRGFADSADSPYAYELNRLGSYDILLGDETGSCKPEEELTRAQLCALFSQLLRYSVPGESRFSDVSADAWYAPAVNAMAELGLVQGTGDGTFDPDGTLTHEQYITLLARLSTWLSIDQYETSKEAGEAVESAEGLEAYSDWSRDSAWLLGRTRQNLLGEYLGCLWEDVSEIDPGSVTTREEAACGLWRMLDDIGMV